MGGLGRFLISMIQFRSWTTIFLVQTRMTQAPSNIGVTLQNIWKVQLSMATLVGPTNRDKILENDRINTSAILSGSEQINVEVKNSILFDFNLLTFSYRIISNPCMAELQVESNQLVSLQSQYTSRQLKVLSPEITVFNLMSLLSSFDNFSSRSYRNIDLLIEDFICIKSK